MDDDNQKNNAMKGEGGLQETRSDVPVKKTKGKNRRNVSSKAKRGKRKGRLKRTEKVKAPKFPEQWPEVGSVCGQNMREASAVYNYEDVPLPALKALPSSRAGQRKGSRLCVQGEEVMSQPETSKFVFDDRIRFLLRSKRMEHGLSYQGLSNFLHVSWGTVRKWEQGAITTCHVSQVPLLRQFIDGEMDEEIRLARFAMKTSSYIPKLPREAKNCIEKYANTIYLCSSQPELREELLEYLDETSKTSLLWLVSPDLDSPYFSLDNLPD